MKKRCQFFLEKFKKISRSRLTLLNFGLGGVLGFFNSSVVMVSVCVQQYPTTVVVKVQIARFRRCSQARENHPMALNERIVSLTIEVSHSGSASEYIYYDLIHTVCKS